MDWVIAISAALQAIATIVLVACTIRYVKLTSHILIATSKPEIVVSLRPHEAHVYLAMLWIENVGMGVARNVKFMGDFSRRFDGKTQLKEIGFFKNGIDVLGPGQKIDHFLVSTIENPEVLKQTAFELTVTYSDSSGNHKDKKVFHLNFGEYEGTTKIDGTPLYDIAKATKEIQKDLHNLITGFSKPIIRTVPLSEDSLRRQASTLESRMAKLPLKTQQEILRTIASLLNKKEQDVREEHDDDETIRDQMLGEHINEKSVEDGYTILDELVGFMERERKDDIR